MNRKARNTLIVLGLVGALIAGWLIMGGGAFPWMERERESAGLDRRFDPPPSGDTPAAPPVKISSQPFRESNADAADERATVQVKVSWASDKQPAKGVIVSGSVSGSHGYTGIFERTDHEGVATIVGLQPGTRYIRCQLGGSERVELKAGETKAVSLVIPEGTRVTGFVSDEFGEPVAGAEVLVKAYGGNVALAATEAGAEGEFELRDVRQHTKVGARAPGYVPSEFVTIARIAKSATQSIRLQMQSGAPRLTGTVYARGDPPMPLSGATIRLARTYNLRRGPCPQQITTTDDKGAFVFESVWPGALSLWVQCAGYGGIRSEFEMEESTHRGITLDPGASIRGVVRTRSGLPVPDASVRTQVPRWDRNGPQTRTGKDGSFILSDLPQGMVRVMASKRSVGRATGSVEVRPNHFSEWNPIMDPGLTISGRVIDPDGKGLADWLVNARYDPERSGDGHLAQAQTKADGRFILTNLRDPKAGVELRAARRGDRSQRITLGHPVMVGATGVILQAPAPPKHTISGVVQGHSKPLEGVRITIRDSAHGSNLGTTMTDELGRFHFSKLYAEKHVLYVSRPSARELQVPVTVVESEVTTDCGIIKLPTAELTIALKTRDSKARSRSVITLRRGRMQTVGRRDSSVTSTHFIGTGGQRVLGTDRIGKPMSVSPGTYQIDASYPGSATIPQVITIQDGQEREVLLEFRSTHTHELVVHLSPEMREEQLWWSVGNERFRTLASGTIPATGGDEAVVRIALFPNESYLATINSSSGKFYGHTRFTLGNSSTVERSHITPKTLR